MTEKISIYRASPDAIRKVFLTCIKEVIAWTAGGLIVSMCISLYFRPENLSYHNKATFIVALTAVFSVAGILFGLRNYKDTYTGLGRIGAIIGVLSSLTLTMKIGVEDLIVHVFVSLLIALNCFMIVRIRYLWMWS